MKSKLKRIFSAVLSLSLVGCMMPATAITTSADESTPVITAMENVQEGVILHAWQWSFNNIKDNMAAIAEAGYTAVQTSVIQQSKQSTVGETNSVWWLYYQPANFTIDDTGNSALGTKAEFAAMCEEAHKYGIHVIVDVVSNHLGNQNGYDLSSTIPDDIRNDSNCWHSEGFTEIDYSSRYSITHGSMGGLPDLNTENTKIQNYVIDYLKECIDCGADGFRFDAAKHISVPIEGSEYTFWSSVIPAAESYYETNGIYDSLYCYGEILGGTDGPDISGYTQYMSVTDNTTGNGIRENIVNGNAAGAANSYYNLNAGAEKSVLWAESHDTYSNDSYESTSVSDSNINKTWALVASRNNATALYFARTNGYRGGYIGEIYSTQCFSDEVKAVNQFHNAFNGQSEYLAYSGNIAYNERGKKGVVLVNVNGNSTSVSVTANRMVDGTYTDQITGNTFTVSGGTISGTIGDTGIAVVYNTDDVAEPVITNNTLYLVPNSNWTQDGARFAMYLFNDSENAWISMTDTDGDGTYEADVPTNAEWTNVIFCRMNGSATENNWDNKWNQTDNLFPDTNTDRYTVTANTWNKGGGTWDLYHTHSYGEPVWTWTDDYSSATATFTCSGCSKSVTVTDSAPVRNDFSNIHAHGAVITGPDGNEYYDLSYEPMVVQESPTGGVEYQIENAELLCELYRCVINQTTFDNNTPVDVSSLQIPSSDAQKAIYALINCFPETFCIDTTTGWGYSTQSGYVNTITFSYTMTKEEFDTKLIEFYSKASEYFALLEGDMDDFTKALVLHDRLVLDHYYQIQSDTEYSSNYTFMIDGWGRCENYAEVYAYLLAMAGIKSEIVDGNAGGAHGWIKICLDGKWYNIDITFDDPIVNNSDRPNKVSHKFFLVSDDVIQDSAYHTTVHSDFTSNYAADTSYDEYNNLHSNENPIFYADDAFWTVYTKADEDDSDFENGVLAVYDADNDEYIDFDYGDILPIKDRWSAGGSSVWLGNYSNLAEYNGKLYINGEHTVYEFDPETSIPTEFITYSDHQLYGIYVKDDILYGLSADSPNDTPTPVVLRTFNSNKYTVRWVNYDGTELEVDENVTEGTMPAYDGATPVKESTAQYDYTFSGWTPEVTAVTENITYEANYAALLRSYTVTWLNEDGTELEVDENVEYGSTPTYDGATPVKESTAQYDYTFDGWSPEVTAITGNTVYTAVFTQTDNSETGYYLIGTMTNWAVDSAYALTLNVNAGTLEYMISDVALTNGDEFKFVYADSDSIQTWYPNGMNNNYVINADGKYTIYCRPNYDGGSDWHYSVIYATLSDYTVIWKNEDGTVLETDENVQYDTTPTYDGATPVKESTAQYDYTFSGWAPEISAVTGDVTYTAQFNKYTKVIINSVDINGVATPTTVYAETYTNADYTVPKDTYLDGYTFSGWKVNDGETLSTAEAVQTAVETLVKAGTAVTVAVVYIKNESTHIVSFTADSVVGCTIKNANGEDVTGQQCQVSEQLYAVADKAAPDQKFSHWEVNGVTVGYETTYAFRMPDEDMTLSAVYVDNDEEVNKIGTGYIESVKRTAKNKLSFVAILCVPDDCQMMKAGVVVQSTETLDGAELTTANARLTRYSDTSKNHYSSYKYTWTMTTSNYTKEWTVRPYLEYTDNNGDTQIIYGEAVSKCVNDVDYENAE